MKLHVFTIPILIVALSSCVTTPKSAKPRLGVKIPDGWAERAASKPVADSKWIKSFRDQQLLALVKEAQEHNKNLKATAARIRSAEATAVIAGAALTPRAGIDLDGSRSQRNFIGFPFGPGGGQVINSSLSNSFGLRLSASWEVDIWGRIRAAKSAALAEVQASESDYNAAQLSVAAQTARVWFAMVEAKEQRDLALRALKIFEQTEGIIRRAFEGGVGREGEDLAAQLQLAQADIETARAMLNLREEQLVRLRKQIDVVLGRYPTGELAGASRLPNTPGRPPAGVPAELLDRRPDLVAAERRLAAADQRVLEAKRSLLPQINLTGNYGTGTPDLEEILNSDFTVWTFASGVSQPILEGRRLRETVKLRQASSEVALAEYQQTALTAFREVEEALAADGFLAQREAAFRKAAELSQSALDRAQDDYKGGVGDVLTLLRAQQQLIQSEGALIDARRARLDNRIDLHTALGGDFRARE